MHMKIEKFSMGIGDRFGHQGRAQLAAFTAAARVGVHVIPVWNKSNREHLLVHSEPSAVRAEADDAVRALDWKGTYHVDADHIGIKTVDRFLPVSDFFTIDVADFIGKPTDEPGLDDLIRLLSKVGPRPEIPSVSRPFELAPEKIRAIAAKYLSAVKEAGRVYRYIEKSRGRGNFITEVSMDETDRPQTPEDLLVILAALACEGVPVQTIAPKFTGRFNKGVDYQGDPAVFEREFMDDIAVVAFAVRHFGLPGDLKLSVHSGSDKFSIYAPINRTVKRMNCGLHLKTAGTTWLEEIATLAAVGGEGTTFARELYAGALEHYDELCAPYASVIDIDKSRLPSAQKVQSLPGGAFAAMIRHDPNHPAYNPSVRQLLHVGYKLAANAGPRYTSLLKTHAEPIGRAVTENILSRHLLKIFG